MKKSILIFSIAFLTTTITFAQDGINKKDPEMFTQLRDNISNKDRMEFDNQIVIDNFYKAFATGDIYAILDSMDPKIVWNEAEGSAYADGNPYIGPDAVLNGVFVRVWAEHEFFNFKDIQFQKIRNNKILVTLRHDGKIKQTGKIYNAQAAHLWTLKNGKIISFQQYADTKKMNDALAASGYAIPTSRLYDLESLSLEIEVLLKSSNYKVKKGDSVMVFFSIGQDRKIQNVMVATQVKSHCNFLEKNLKDLQLDGNNWREGMIYELSVDLFP